MSSYKKNFGNQSNILDALQNIDCMLSQEKNKKKSTTQQQKKENFSDKKISQFDLSQSKVMNQSINMSDMTQFDLDFKNSQFLSEQKPISSFQRKSLYYENKLQQKFFEKIFDSDQTVICQDDIEKINEQLDQKLTEMDNVNKKKQALKKFIELNQKILQDELSQPNFFLKDCHILPFQYISQFQIINDYFDVKIVHSFNSKNNYIISFSQTKNKFIKSIKTVQMMANITNKKKSISMINQQIPILQQEQDIQKPNLRLLRSTTTKSSTTEIHQQQFRLEKEQLSRVEKVDEETKIIQESENCIIIDEKELFSKNYELKTNQHQQGDQEEKVDGKHKLEEEKKMTDQKQQALLKISEKLSKNINLTKVFQYFCYLNLDLSNFLNYKYKRNMNVSINFEDDPNYINQKKERKVYKRFEKQNRQQNQSLLSQRQSLIQLRTEDYKIIPFEFKNYQSKMQEIKLNVPADGLFPDIGEITHASEISKLRSNTVQFHSRWIVLRGFYLYWYRSFDHQKAKGMILLPNKPIEELKVGKHTAFQLKDDNSRELIFLMNQQGLHWRKLLSNQIAYRNYIDLCQKIGIKPQQKLISYFQNEDFMCLDTSELGIKIFAEEDEILYENLFYLTTDSILYHQNLIEINLSKSNITLQIFSCLINTLCLESHSKIQIQIFLLEKNNINAEFIYILEKYLINENSLNLKKLSLDNNDLFDDGIQILSKSIEKRHYFLNSLSKTNELPLLNLSLSSVKMGDKGFQALTSAFEQIHLVNQQKRIQYTQFISLNVSGNNMKNDSIKLFAHLIEKFNGIQKLNMEHLKKIGPDSLKFLMQSLKQNVSITTLNFDYNQIDLDSYKSIFECLEVNTVLNQLSISIPLELQQYAQNNDLVIQKYMKITNFYSK